MFFKFTSFKKQNYYPTASLLFGPLITIADFKNNLFCKFFYKIALCEGGVAIGWSQLEKSLPLLMVIPFKYAYIHNK
jgi:hypothetical protein